MRKEAIERGLGSDFMAGIDPTGTQTFRYGLEDVPDSGGRNLLRKATGVTGGLLAGALLVPSILYGIIRGGGRGYRARGALNRIRGAVTGFGSGFAKPYADIYHGIRSKKYLQAIKAGNPITAGGEKSMRQLAKSRVSTMAPEGLTNYFLGENMTQNLKDMAVNSPERFERLLQETSGTLANTLAFMGLGGAINAGSALAQYNLGQSMGSNVGERERQQLLRRE